MVDTRWIEPVLAVTPSSVTRCDLISLKVFRCAPPRSCTCVRSSTSCCGSSRVTPTLVTSRAWACASGTNGPQRREIWGRSMGSAGGTRPSKIPSIWSKLRFAPTKMPTTWNRSPRSNRPSSAISTMNACGPSKTWVQTAGTPATRSSSPQASLLRSRARTGGR